MPIITFADTLACLAVESAGEDRFSAPHIPMTYRRVFGGQLLAQCLVIASQSAPEKQVKSLHASFPREGDLALPIDYRVTRIHDGRSFAGRQIVGEQAGRAIVTASVSLHVLESGPEHAASMPDVAAPEVCPASDLVMIPWETRSVGGVDLAARDVGPAQFAFWMRTPPLGDEPVVHQALLAHATDLTLIGTALRPHAGLGESDSPTRVQTAVTTHTLWLHAPFRIDDWLLVHQESPRMAGARAFGLGHVFTRAGLLVASFAQESLIRPLG
jgi:acyl-CoA thioesterase-2